MASLGAMLGSKGKMPMMGADEEEGEDYASPEEEAPEEEAEGEVPPDFQAAYDEYTEMPSASSMYRMIEACKGGSSSGKPGGLALIFGGKGKK